MCVREKLPHNEPSNSGRQPRRTYRSSSEISPPDAGPKAKERVAIWVTAVRDKKVRALESIVR